jgi:hypothetical protein
MNRDVLDEANPPVAQATGDSPLDMIEACEAELTSLSDEVTGLADELVQLRKKGHELSGVLSARDSTIRVQSAGLSKLAEERTNLITQTDATSETLRLAQERIVESDVRIASLERELERLRADIARQEHAASVLLLDPDAQEEADATPPFAAAEAVADPQSIGHLRLISTSAGYRLSISDDACSEPGSHLDIEGERFVVARVGRSPFPGDDRRCAFVMAESGRTNQDQDIAAP